MTTPPARPAAARPPRLLECGAAGSAARRSPARAAPCPPSDAHREPTILQRAAMPALPAARHDHELEAVEGVGVVAELVLPSPRPPAWSRGPSPAPGCLALTLARSSCPALLGLAASSCMRTTHAGVPWSSTIRRLSSSGSVPPRRPSHSASFSSICVSLAMLTPCRVVDPLRYPEHLGGTSAARERWRSIALGAALTTLVLLLVAAAPAGRASAPPPRVRGPRYLFTTRTADPAADRGVRCLQVEQPHAARGTCRRYAQASKRASPAPRRNDPAAGRHSLAESTPPGSARRRPPT